MKNLLLALLILSSCQKEESDPVPSGERKQVGVWHIVPAGNDTDHYSYKVWSGVDSLYNVTRSGQVSDGGFRVPLIEGMHYSIGYRNTFGDSVFTYHTNPPDTDTTVFWHLFIYQDAGYVSGVSFSDTLPATLF